MSKKIKNFIEFEGYSKDYFEKYPNKKTNNAFLYLISINSDEEQFYKIGITTKSINKRFTKLEVPTYKINVEISLKCKLIKAFEYEQHIIAKLKDYKYTPKYKFSGRTECFIYDQYVCDTIKQYMETIINTDRELKSTTFPKFMEFLNDLKNQCNEDDEQFRVLEAVSQGMLSIDIESVLPMYNSDPNIKPDDILYQYLQQKSVIKD